MALDDLTKKAIVQFAADASGFLRSVKQMSDAEDDLHDKRKQQAKETDGLWSRMEAGYKSMSSAVNVAAGVWHKALDVLEDYGKRLDLTAAAGTISIDRLAAATGGLKTNMEVLAHAAKLNQSAFKLTEDQMVQVEQAMYALEERGESSEAVWSAFSSALTKGTVRSLEQFGIIIDTTGLKLDENGVLLDKFGQRGEAVDAIFKGINKTLGEDMANAQHDAADSIQALTVRLRNSWDDLKFGLANLATAFTPVLAKMTESLQLSAQFASLAISGLGGATGGSGGAIGTISDAVGTVMSPLAYAKWSYKKATDFTGYEVDTSFFSGKGGLNAVENKRQRIRAEGALARLGIDLDQLRELGAQGADWAPTAENKATMAALYGATDPADAMWAMGSGGPVGVAGIGWSDSEKSIYQLAIEAQDKLKKSTGGAAGSPRAVGENDILGLFGIDPMRIQMDALNEKFAAADTLRRRDAESAFRTSSYGGVGLGDSGLYGSGGYGSYGGFDRYSQLDVDLGAVMGRRNFDEINSRDSRYAATAGRRNAGKLESIFGKPSEFQLYQNLFRGLGDAIGGTYEAIVKGTEPASQAFKRLIGEMLLAVGKQEAVMAIKDGAWALGSLAFGDMIGFARYGKSALAHGAAAVAAGAAASALGVGGASAGGGTGAGAAAPTGAGAGSGGGERGRDVVVVMTDPFAQDSARNRQNNAEKIVRKAFGGRGGQDN